jgi:hypothetical protein
MSSFPNSPKLQKGALVGLDPFNPLASVVVFQYNPESVTRTLTPQTSGAQSGGAGAPGEGTRLSGPPQESYRLEVVLDATDQLERGDARTGSMGLHPQLAALEMLLYPKSALVIANEVLLRAGVIEVIAPETPLAVLVWGSNRVLPVRLTEFSVTEDMHDPSLNPIHAKVSLGLRVLNYRDLGLLSPGGGLFMAHQLAKEVMATLNSTANAPSALNSLGL